ncbi:MAG: MGDG synthase family glycosyltransferase [Terriglobia bacterium]
MKKILILTLSVGSGHVQASSVIRDALLDGPGEFDVRTLDVVDIAAYWFPWVYVQPYWWMLRYRRDAWRWLYERRHQKRHRATAPHWVFRQGCAKVLKEIKSFDPRLVVVTEIGAAEIAALGKREGWFSAPVLAVLTDFQAEPPWAQPEIDFYCVAADQAKAQLITWGISPNRILVSGIPIDPCFASPFEKAQLRRALGLRPEKPTVLLMAGGMGMAPLDKITSTLATCGVPVQAIAIAGHDHGLHQRLQAMRGKLAIDLMALGWTKRIPELMAAADLLITKPGGLTVSEALASGLPMILTHPIPGPEERNISYLTDRKVALCAKNLHEIPVLAAGLLGHPEDGREMARRERELSRPEAAHTIAHAGRTLLERDTYIDLLVPHPLRSGEPMRLM